ncbi:MAG TPA: nucleotidyltransferase domain-containing protein [Gaiellaceae bacterium]
MVKKIARRMLGVMLISYPEQWTSVYGIFDHMNQTAALPIFRSELQLRLLALMFLRPDRTWTTPELAKRLDATPVTTHREVRRAFDSGLLVREAIGRTYLYRAATDSPLYEPLRLLLERTVGIEVELRRALEDVPGVEAAFIHGSFASRGKIKPTSDIDVIVLGNADPHALRRRIRQAESQLGREIDVLAYSRAEFASLAESGNSLIRGIIRGPVTPLVGSSDALRAA